MVAASAMVLVASVMIASEKPKRPMIRFGGDPARGILRNCGIGAHPFDRPDPSRPTVVFVHGFNPAPKIVHFSMSDRFAESLARRGGSPLNILSWEWNAATFDSMNPKTNAENALHQGHLLVESLLATGIDPRRIHLIGHSAGGMVVTSAAHHFARDRGTPVDQLTLLEPATFYHEIIFRKLEAGSLAPRVENYWSPGPSAYGTEVALPGVTNYQVAGTASYRGVLFPLQSDHISIVSWYLQSVEDPSISGGFNSRRLLEGSR